MNRAEFNKHADYYAAMPAGWDGERAQPIAPVAVEHARQVFDALTAAGAHVHALRPDPTGLVLDLYAPGWSATVTPKREAEVYCDNGGSVVYVLYGRAPALIVEMAVEGEGFAPAGPYVGESPATESFSEAIEAVRLWINGPREAAA